MEDTLLRDTNHIGGAAGGGEDQVIPYPSTDEILRFTTQKIIFNDEEADLIILKSLTQNTRQQTTHHNRDIIQLNIIDVDRDHEAIYCSDFEKKLA